ncbi:hypothetical protein PsorP6_004869 [Peronosclerospora sorghi]|uniref:Uncharacterized protein n=1 Tax=Peronosclerospora sorghi TaxID=230839 RepID=A0ACC0W4D4_9STRA|nr:hypothetical protein PsorP6_004869 [Peronosclerospora sorghi]
MRIPPATIPIAKRTTGTTSHGFFAIIPATIFGLLALVCPTVLSKSNGTSLTKSRFASNIGMCKGSLLSSHWML